MSLTEKDLIKIEDLIDKKLSVALENNNDKLVKMFFEHFPARDEVVTRVDLRNELQPIKDQLNTLQDTVAGLDAKFTESIAMTDSQILDIKHHLRISST